MFKTAIAVATAALIAASSPAPAQAKEWFNGKGFNGLTLNGKGINGTAWNGISLQGASENGRSWQGKTVNGRQLNSKQANGALGSGMEMEAAPTVVEIVLPGGEVVPLR